MIDNIIRHGISMANMATYLGSELDASETDPHPLLTQLSHLCDSSDIAPVLARPLMFPARGNF